MSYDIFWTHSYKGGFISGKRDIATGAEVITYQLPYEQQWREAKSYRAAQQRISRFGVRDVDAEIHRPRTV